MTIRAGYGGGMSSAKAALESDTKVLSFEAGRKYGIRVNTISAGPLGSRAAKAIGFIDDMIRSVASPHRSSHSFRNTLHAATPQSCQNQHKTESASSLCLRTTAKP